MLRHILSPPLRRSSSAKRQNIRVIMLAAKPGARDIMRKRATDMRMAVGSDRNADARSADQNAPSGLTGLDGIGQLVGEIGIVDGSGAICAQIQPLHIGQSDFQRFFKGKATLITGNGYDAF